MARLALLATAAALAAALFLRFESRAEGAATKNTKTECPAEELCLVSIF